MKRRIVHRGVVALAIVTSLSLAGAQPAAAANLNLLDRLSHLWSMVTGLPAFTSHQESTRPAKLPGKSTTTTPAPGDRGWGIDPNGNTLTGEPGLPQGNG
jgi:hypothetical protein